MARCAVVNSSTLVLGGRWDAPFYIKLAEMLEARGFDGSDIEDVRKIIDELNGRGEIPKGQNTKVPVHVECPSCLSWAVNSVETTTVTLVDNKRTSSFSAHYGCRNCEHEWDKQERA